MADTMNLTKIRNQAADADMRRAKRYGSHIVAGTLKGNVTITYYPPVPQNSEFWVLRIMGQEGDALACGAGRYGKKQVREALSALYRVEVQ